MLNAKKNVQFFEYLIAFLRKGGVFRSLRVPFFATKNPLHAVSVKGIGNAAYLSCCSRHFVFRYFLSTMMRLIGRIVQLMFLSVTVVE